jgi:uncharacterized protein involved in exopolysaccharide biosynthesis
MSHIAAHRPEPQSEWYVASVQVLRDARSQWPSVVGLALLGAVVGGATALILPSYYRAGAAFQAESNAPAGITGALGGVAAQLGAQLSTQTDAQFFGDLLTAEVVLRRVARDTFPDRGRQAFLADIYGYGKEPPAKRDFDTARKLRSAISVDVNIRTSVIRFTVEARTPELAAALAQAILSSLNAANVELRRERAAAERDFTSERAENAKAELRSAEEALAAFYERNRSIAGSPGLQLLEAQLKRQVEMAQQVYVQLRLQEEQAALQEVRNTPTISVVDPPLVPVKRSWPNRRLAVVAGLLIGLALSLLRIIAAPARLARERPS